MSGAADTQAANAVLMVRPRRFGSNPETHASNFFQRPGASEEIAERARTEVDRVAVALGAAGVRVELFAGSRDADNPDEVFPSNWVSFHSDGTVVLYPMLAPSRRRERRRELLEALERERGYAISRIVDLTGHELEGRYLEATGSLVLDHVQKVAYACLSPRTHAEVLADFAARLGYSALAFEATDARGLAIYHTDVMMSVGSGLAVVCLEAIVGGEARETLRSTLESSGRELIELSKAQMHAFAGNLLELRGRDGPVLAMSTQALSAFGSAQRRRLEAHAAIVAEPIPTLEAYGGGSMRCMLADIHLRARIR
jgi:hypothetical protein